MQESYSVFSWIDHRQYRGSRCGAIVAGQRRVQDSLWGKVFSNKKGLRDKDDGSGGVFGLTYSPNGEVLVAACENHCFSLMDPLMNKLIYIKQNAHSDCCNNISFVDERLFASCSDDSTVAIWDLRNLSREVSRLGGHTSWVKNVEIHRPSGKIVTSGFDDLINICDLNVTDNKGEVKVEKLLTVEGLLRMRLSLQGDSMYISSNNIAEVVAIDNLDLCALDNDIGFLQSVRSARGIRTKSKRIHANEEKQCDSSDMRNLIRLIWTDERKSSFVYGLHVPCHSIDVHPRNSALLLHHISEYAGYKWTAVHNMKRHISPVDKIDFSRTLPHLTLPRGLITHILRQAMSGSGEYIEEVSFSSCGRLIASPLGYGVVIAAFDSKINDYEISLIHRANSASKSCQKRKRDDDSETPQCTGGFFHKPQKLHVLKHSFGHHSQVLSTSFSPTHVQLATGCKDGVILFHNPEL